MKKNIINQERAAIGTDMAIATIVIILFVSIITSLFYNVYTINQKVNRNIEATDIITSIFEKIETISYDKVTIQDGSEVVTFLEENSGLKLKRTSIQNQIYTGTKSGYTVKVEITKYADLPENAEKNLEDIIKIIKVTVNYKIGNDVQNVEMRTLKMK